MRALALLLAISASLPAIAQSVPLPRDESELTGAIAGRVCRDVNFDGECTSDEPGISGVRLVLETGHAVITDGDGRFHFAAVDSRQPVLVRPLGPGTARVAGVLPGRHRLKVDRRSLPSGSRMKRQGVTLEVPLAGVVLHHFAVEFGRAPPPPLVTGQQGVPPESRIEAEGLSFEIAGTAAPGSTVEVAGITADVDPSGRFSALVPLKEGSNLLQLKLRSPDGTVQLFAQDVDLVRRPSGLLVVPRQPRPLATLELAQEEAPTGRSTLPVVAAPGTRVQVGESTVTVGESGRAEVPMNLTAGRSELGIIVTPPGSAPLASAVSIAAAPRPFAVGLLEVELGLAPSSGRFVLGGSGGIHAEHRMGELALDGELSLQEADFGALRAGGVATLIRPRRPERFERWLDPERHPLIWNDTSVSTFANASEGRLRLRLMHDRFGAATLGSYRAVLEGETVGDYHRAIFGPALEGRVAISEAVSFRAKVFAAPGLADPTRPLTRLPAHEEFRATGGSLFYVSRTPVVEGAERVKIATRDPSTGLVLDERVLVRGRDYELDPLAGRILLREPLSFARIELTSEPIGALPENVLVVDYAYLSLQSGGRASGGGELGLELGPLQLSAGGVQEGRGEDLYRLVRARAAVEFVGLTLSLEGAGSRGQSLAPGALGISDTGGLDFHRGRSLAPDAEGTAFVARLRGSPLGAGGRIEAVAQLRSHQFSDDSRSNSPLSQLAVRASQRVGDVVLGIEANTQELPDPAIPLQDLPITTQVLGGSVQYIRPRWQLKVQGRDVAIRTFDEEFTSFGVPSGRTSAGLAGRYAWSESLALLASHKHVLATRGSGPGTFDDTFSSVGAEVDLGHSTRFGIRGGWGPTLGPLGFFSAQHQRGQDTFYGGYSVDVDGPDVGMGRAFTGARTQTQEGASAYVEDVTGAGDELIRLSRAVGVGHRLGESLSVGARYERGQVFRFEIPEPLVRSAAGIHASWILERVQLFAKAEERRESRAGAELVQRLLLTSAEWRIAETLSIGGRFQFGDTQRDDDAQPRRGLVWNARAARFVEGSAGLAWRPGPFIGIFRYSITAEQSPDAPVNAALVRREVVSLMPGVRLGRFSLAAGGHAGFTSFGEDTDVIFSASLRPSFQVVGGLEVAAEVARRSAAPNGGELSAVRGEVAYAFTDEARLGLGYTVFGFSGTGVVEEGNTDRVYLRAELAY